MLKTFYLERKEDVSGVSGTGRVAIGAIYPSGRAVIEWLTESRSINIYESVSDVEKIHGHEGRTILVWNNDTSN